MIIIIYQMKDYSISLDQARYATTIVDKYLDNTTVKNSTKFYKTTVPFDIIFTKADTYTSDEQVDKVTRKLNSDYRACIVSLIYLLCTIIYLSFLLHVLANVLSNAGKVYFEGLVHLLRYVRENKTLGLSIMLILKMHHHLTC